MRTYSVTRCTDYGLWDAFVTTSPHGSIFARTEWLSLLDARFECWLVWAGSEPWLGALMLLDDAGPIRAPYSFSLYQGLFWGERLSSQPWHSRARHALEATTCLLEQLESVHSRLSFCMHPNYADVRPLSWFHYHEPERGRFDIGVWYTGLIELGTWDGFDDYLASIRKTRRQDYRRAVTLGCVVAPLDLDDLNTLESLYLKMFSHQGLEVDPALVARMRRVAQCARKAGFGEVLVCHDRAGTPLSATLFLHDDRCGYYLVGANDPANRDTGCGTFLVIENIRRCSERGLERVDVCGMNSPDRGDFKASLNAAPVPYFVATWEK